MAATPNPIRTLRLEAESKEGKDRGGIMKSELQALREQREKANEAQRLWKLRNYSDEALERTKQRALQRVRDLEKVQGERQETR